MLEKRTIVRWTIGNCNCCAATLGTHKLLNPLTSNRGQVSGRVVRFRFLLTAARSDCRTSPIKFVGHCISETVRNILGDYQLRSTGCYTNFETDRWETTANCYVEGCRKSCVSRIFPFPAHPGSTSGRPQQPNLADLPIATIARALWAPICDVISLRVRKVFNGGAVPFPCLTKDRYPN